MPRLNRTLLALLMGSTLSPAFAATAGDAETLLHELRQAYGGERWHHVGALQFEGEETTDGLTGHWHGVVDRRTGYHTTRVNNDLFAQADGYDAQGRWRQDTSGLLHPLDSPEATIVAVSESWLRGFAFLDPEAATSYRVLPDAEEGGRVFAKLEATPAEGRAVTLWIDPVTHRLDRAVWQNSFLAITERYADYRDVNGLQLPFRIVTSSATVAGTADGESIDKVDHYRVLDAANGADVRRPEVRVHDVRMTNDVAETTTKMRLEGGVLLVDVSIDGHPSMPFILDTGGHAILTSDAAKQLGFQTQGNGVSTGSGPGSMRTSYTKVRDIALGDAHVRDLTFLVMPYPYSFYDRGQGQEPIAGILGLEIFERFAVTFDYDRGQLRLQPYDHGTPPAPAKGDVLTLRFTDDMPLTEATQDGRAGMFGIDTGNAGYVLTFPQWAERQGIATHYASGVPIATGGVGGLFTAHIAHAKALTLGDQRLTNVIAMLTRADAGATGNPSEAGNIGQDVLARFNVHFDYHRQQMVLMPRANPPAWHYAMAGFRASKKQDQPDRFEVIDVMPGSPAAQTGLKLGDAIVAANGKQATAMGFSELRDLSSHAPEGTPLVLTLADGRTLTMTMADFAPK